MRNDFRLATIGTLQRECLYNIKEGKAILVYRYATILVLAWTSLFIILINKKYWDNNLVIDVVPVIILILLAINMFKNEKENNNRRVITDNRDIKNIYITEKACTSKFITFNVVKSKKESKRNEIYILVFPEYKPVNVSRQLYEQVEVNDRCNLVCSKETKQIVDILPLKTFSLDKKLQSLVVK